MNKEDYIKKMEDFTRENKFKELQMNPMEKYQKQPSDAVKKSTKVIKEEYRPKMNILNAKSPL